jgi:uncharacterized protein YneF (UPF0154 family)
MSVIFIILINISIHVFLQGKTFIESFTGFSSLLGLAIGMVVGISLGLYLSNKILKHYNSRLEQLKNNLKEL